MRFLPQVLRKTRPIHLTFFVTKRCNQRCPFCFYEAQKDGGPGADGPRKELGLEEIEKVSASLGSLLWLAFSGGEVFLRDDIVEISKIFYKNNRPSIMLYPTNGMQAEVIFEKISRILRDCPRSAVVVKLSMDGIGEKHDRMRGTHGSFERLMKTYTKLSGLLPRHRNIELGINTVFLRDNQDDMREIADFVKGLKGIKTHTITLIRGNRKDVAPEKYLNAIEMLEKGLKDGTSPIYGFRGARLKAAQDILQRRLIHKTMTENRRMLPCHAGRLNLVLTETGDVYPCESFTRRLGNVREHGYDLRTLLKNENAKASIASITEDKCFCTHECYMMTNILCNPATYPALLNYPVSGLTQKRPYIMI